MPFPGGLALLVADPPCTPWSRAGKRQGLADPNDCLALTVALISALRPHAWLVGNVPGLEDATHHGIIRRTLGLLAPSYAIDFCTLDAAAYGTPQHRIRP